MSTEKRKTYSKRVRPPIDAVLSIPSSPKMALKRRREDAENEPVPDNAPRVLKKRKTFKEAFQSTRKLPPAGVRVQAETGKPMRQLTLALSSKPSMVSCNICALSYMRGAAEDEALHKSHCTRVLRGSAWSRDDEHDAVRSDAYSVVSRCGLSSGQHGRIISIRANVGGRLGAKMETIMSTVNLALSSPPLSPKALAASKIYLFLLPSPKSTRERIVGCIIAQNIGTAMEIVKGGTSDKGLVHVDQGVYCDPTPLPTSMGISRVFVAKDCRRLGIARTLLDAACRTFLHGCTLNPAKGQIAFSQPTGDGQKLMESWGKGNIRIYEE